MKRYGNRHGRSGVRAYEIGADSIAVQFAGSDEVYRYSYRSAGRERVEHMKALAEAGRGLSTFIARHVRNDYER
ncbi:MAG: hypothetical protein AB1430_22780 [Pseudomonadota bacterium]